VSTSERLDVERVQRLRHRHQDTLRVQVQLPGDASPVDALTDRAGEGPLRGRALEPGKAYDLVPSYNAALWLVSDRFKEALEGSPLTGWKLRPVEVEGDGVPPRLWLLMATGRSGPVYRGGSDERPGLPRFGRFLDPAEWDGSDFFVPPGSGGLLASARAAEQLEEAGLSNVTFEPAGLEPTP
jgi:hypothetical protein